jgi:lipopolysaccharide export system permease protein
VAAHLESRLMRMSYTLTLYFGRQFLVGLAIVLAVLAAVAFLFEIAELMRRAANREEMSAFLVFEMGLLRLPLLMQKILPIAALFGSMLAFYWLTRSHQLVVARGAGVSVWQFITPALLLALAIGMLSVMVFDPIAAAAAARFEQLEGRYFRGQASSLAVAQNGLWLRQAGPEGQSVIHSEQVGQQGEELTLVTIFFYEGADRFSGRVDAKTAMLRPGHWELFDVLLSGPGRAPQHLDRYIVPTTLTLARIQDSFAPPETLSFWELPPFIDTLREAGFSALNHRLHWHTLLSSPLLLLAMVLIAATFSLRLTRHGYAGILIVGGVFVGLVLYVISDIVLALGLAGSVPAALAAWTPAGVSTLLGAATLFHLEDG